ncbi:MAG: hypothetical protein LBE83_00110, partial [Propionibacteriaceae bacterium]|nr:hypothetical protein [Propionibacteriaceae bacterium]
YTPRRTWRLIQRRGRRAGWISEGTSVRTAVDWLTQAGDDGVSTELGARLVAFRDHLEAQWYGPREAQPPAMPAQDARLLWRQIRRFLAAMH